MGKLLLETKEPLAQALKILRPLEKSAAGRVSTWLLSYEVAIRRRTLLSLLSIRLWLTYRPSSSPEKYLQALHALRTAHSIDPHSAPLHLLIVRFTLLLPTLSDISEVVGTTLRSALVELSSSLPVDVFNSSILQHNASDAASILVAAKGLLAIRGGEASRPEVENLVFQLTRAETSYSIEVRQCISARIVWRQELTVSLILVRAGGRGEL